MNSIYSTRIFFIIYLLIITGFGCTSSIILKNSQSEDPAHKLYLKSQKDFKSGLYPEAIKGFSEIRTKHPYSEFARLAMLKIADSKLKQNNYNEAIDLYRDFLRYYPSHNEAANAMLSIGDAYFEQIPNDYWFLPPVAEKEQVNIRNAILAYNKMALKFPNNTNTKLALKHIKTCRYKLADHEIYVAKFYFKRDQYKATIKRCDYLLLNYPLLGFNAECLLLKAQSYFQLNEINSALNVLNEIINTFPDSKEAKEAKKLLELNSPA